MANFLTDYRPLSWDTVIGQSAIIQSLRGTVESKSARSILFTGPSGVGKTTLARISAGGVGCSPENLIELDAATHTGIDAMRELKNVLRYKPLGPSTVRAVIVDECQALSKASWQSLLKSIEEPSEGLYWFFCTTEPSRVPVTIQTRCVQYHLKLVRRDDLADLVEQVARKEQITLSEEIGRVIVSEADGSPRKALANLAACADCESVDEAYEVLQAMDGESDELRKFCRAMLDGKLSWEVAKSFLVSVKESDGESVRRSVVGYLKVVLLAAKSKETAMSTFELLDQFSDPCFYNDLPLLLGVGRVVEIQNREEG